LKYFQKTLKYSDEITLVWFWQWSPGMKVDSDARPPKRFKPDTSFSREEFEIMATHNSSKKGDSQGDRMLEWASNPAFRSKNVRRLKMKT
jgi:hypothetical protein